MNIALHLGCLNAELLNLSYRMAYVMTIGSAVIGVACIAAEYRTGRFSWFLFYLLIVLAQPGWRFGWHDLVMDEGAPGLADCGYGLRAESILLDAVAAAILIAILCGNVRKRVFFLWLSVICWATSLAAGSHWWWNLFDESSSLVFQIQETIIGVAHPGVRYAALFTVLTAALWIIECARRGSQPSGRSQESDGVAKGNGRDRG